MVKAPEAKRGFVLPRRWVVERSFAWTARFGRLARDYERLPNTLAGLHFLVLVCLMLHKCLPYINSHMTLIVQEWSNKATPPYC